jgi:DNA polymerase III epsilon subunit-like protein
VISLDVVRGSSLAVVGLETTTGAPPLITEAAVYHLARGVVTAGPLAWPVAPDAPIFQIPHRSRPNLRLAPPWSQVAGHVVAALARRVVVTHDETRFNVLRRHLPDWEPEAVLFTRDLAETVWPGLDSYGLESVSVAVGISRVPGVGAGAVVEAYAVAMVLRTLAREAVRHGDRVRSARGGGG